MALFGVGSAIQKAIQTLILPEFEFIKGELKRLDGKIDSVKAEIKTEIKRLDQKIDSVDKRIDSVQQEIHGVNQRMDNMLRFHERLARLEAKMEISA